MTRRRARRTAHYQALGEDFLRRMDQRTAARPPGTHLNTTEETTAP